MSRWMLRSSSNQLIVLRQVTAARRCEENSQSDEAPPSSFFGRDCEKQKTHHLRQVPLQCPFCLGIYWSELRH